MALYKQAKNILGALAIRDEDSDYKRLIQTIIAKKNNKTPFLMFVVAIHMAN